MLKQTNFKYLDLFVCQINDGIKISQNNYIENLKSNEEILTKKEMSQLRLMTGTISWVRSQTRPDTTFRSCKIADY